MPAGHWSRGASGEEVGGTPAEGGEQSRGGRGTWKSRLPNSRRLSQSSISSGRGVIAEEVLLSPASAVGGEQSFENEIFLGESLGKESNEARATPQEESG
jgi:hypothetical protein